MTGIFVWLRQVACVWAGSDAPQRCRADFPAPSAAASSVFVFGVWMWVLGLTIFVAPTLNTSARIRSLATSFGFPSHGGMWSRIFGAAVANLGIFYFVGALSEIRPFFWMTVFGRLGVFAVCSYFACSAHSPDVTRPYGPLVLAVPDLAGATLTSWFLLPDYPTRVAFLGGLALLSGALGFVTFPAWITTMVGCDVRPSAWNLVLATILFFFGAYAWLAALLNLRPLVWTTIFSNAILLRVAFFGALFDRTANQSSVAFKGTVFALFIGTTVTLVLALRDLTAALAVTAE